jgi:hypothetical protein
VSIVTNPEHFGLVRQLLWGAFAGLIPILIQLWKRGIEDISLDLPGHIGSFFLLAIFISLLLGAVTSRAFAAHHAIAAMYHGATAPITLAFVLGINTHIPH